MPIQLTRKAKGSPPLSSAWLRGVAVRMLTELGLRESELSLLLTNDSLIHEINLEHRGKDKPTDVLSFPQAEFTKPLVPKRGHTLAVLGDVVISLDTALRQARGRRRPLEDEMRFLLAHGILHLVGHDHMTPEEKKVMTKATRALVRASLGAPALAAARSSERPPPKRLTVERSASGGSTTAPRAAPRRANGARRKKAGRTRSRRARV